MMTTESNPKLIPHKCVLCGNDKMYYAKYESNYKYWKEKYYCKTCWPKSNKNKTIKK